MLNTVSLDQSLDQANVYIYSGSTGSIYLLPVISWGTYLWYHFSYHESGTMKILTTKFPHYSIICIYSIIYIYIIPACTFFTASLLKGLKHANIVTLHDIIHTRTNLTFVFEYVVSWIRDIHVASVLSFGWILNSWWSFTMSIRYFSLVYHLVIIGCSKLIEELKFYSIII